jgi:hypothetical protein
VCAHTTTTSTDSFDLHSFLSAPSSLPPPTPPLAHPFCINAASTHTSCALVVEQRRSLLSFLISPPLCSETINHPLYTGVKCGGGSKCVSNTHAAAGHGYHHHGVVARSARMRHWTATNDVRDAVVTRSRTGQPTIATWLCDVHLMAAQCTNIQPPPAASSHTSMPTNRRSSSSSAR